MIYIYIYRPVPSSRIHCAGRWRQRDRARRRCAVWPETNWWRLDWPCSADSAEWPPTKKKKHRRWRPNWWPAGGWTPWGWTPWPEQEILRIFPLLTRERTRQRHDQCGQHQRCFYVDTAAVRSTVNSAGFSSLAHWSLCPKTDNFRASPAFLRVPSTSLSSPHSSSAHASSSSLSVAIFIPRNGRVTPRLHQFITVSLVHGDFFVF